MPWWWLLSRQISRNSCWLKTSGIFRPEKTAVLRQHLNNRCFKIHILAGGFLQSRPSEVFKTQLEKSLSNPVWSHSWPSSDKEVGSEPSGGPFQTEWLWCAHGLLQCLKARTWSTPVVPLRVLILRVIPLHILLISKECFEQQLTFSSSVSCYLTELSHSTVGENMEKVTMAEAPGRRPS